MTFTINQLRQIGEDKGHVATQWVGLNLRGPVAALVHATGPHSSKPACFRAGATQMSQRYFPACPFGVN